MFFVLFGCLPPVSQVAFDYRICFARIKRTEDVTNRYTLHGSLWDLGCLAVVRILSALLAILVGYSQREPPKSPFEPYDKYGRRKSKEDLENEALEEPILPMLKRYIYRSSFLCEVSVLLTGTFIFIKSLTRLNVEIGLYGESVPQHPVFWTTLGLTALFSLLESLYVDVIENLAGELGRKRRLEMGETWVDQLSTPLLSRASPEADVEEGGEKKDFDNREDAAPTPFPPLNSGALGADAEHIASWRDLMMIIEPDRFMIIVAFIFLILSSVCQVFVPKFTGAVLDALVDHMHDKDNITVPDTSTLFYDGGGDKNDDHASIVHIPGFVRNIELLVFAALLGGIFGGLRGSIFTVSLDAQAKIDSFLDLLNLSLLSSLSFSSSVPESMRDFGFG